jgi:Tol biopolymer transport system component
MRSPVGQEVEATMSDKIRSWLYRAFALAALAALTLFLVVQLSKMGNDAERPGGIGQAVSPIETPEAPFESPVQAPTPQQMLTRLPTLTPFPTWPPEGPSGTPPPTPPWPPVPTGEPPSDVQSILYIPLEQELAVYRVLVDNQGTRWSEPQLAYDLNQVISDPYMRLYNLSAALSGDRLAATVAYLESTKTWILDLASGSAHRLSACQDTVGCAVRDWSPDGETIILGRSRFGADSPDFVTVDLAGDEVAPLPTPPTALIYPSVTEVVFSPDGRAIAWIVKGAANHDQMTELWLTGSSGEQAKRLVSEKGTIYSLSWHPDSLQLAYSDAPEGQQARAQLLSIESRETTPLLPPSEPSRVNPTWSPDGFRVALTYCEPAPLGTALDARQCSVSVLDRRTDQVSPAVTVSGRGYWDLQWSPDGELLAFISAAQEDLQAVWIFAPQTGNSYPVSSYIRPFSTYAWLPAGLAGGE